MRRPFWVTAALVWTRHRISCIVATKVVDGPVEDEECGTWTETLDAITSWVRAVKNELSSPDLWAELERDSGFQQARDPANTAFSAAEQAEIAEAVNVLQREATRRYSLSDDQVAALATQLQYLAEASMRTGRLDWRNLAAGAIVTLMAEAVLPPDVTRQILVQLMTSVGHLLGHPLPQLPV